MRILLNNAWCRDCHDANAVELNAYHGDKLSQTNNSCAVVFATYSADN